MNGFGGRNMRKAYKFIVLVLVLVMLSVTLAACKDNVCPNCGNKTCTCVEPPVLAYKLMQFESAFNPFIVVSCFQSLRKPRFGEMRAFQS